MEAIGGRIMCHAVDDVDSKGGVSQLLPHIPCVSTPNDGGGCGARSSCIHSGKCCAVPWACEREVGTSGGRRSGLGDATGGDTVAIDPPANECGIVSKGAGDSCHGSIGKIPKIIDSRSVWRKRSLTWNCALENARTLRKRSRCDSNSVTSRGMPCMTEANAEAPLERRPPRRPPLPRRPGFCIPAIRGGSEPDDAPPELKLSRTWRAKQGASSMAELCTSSTRQRANFANAPASGFATRRPSGFF
mmetsp:Transcript_18397/g.51199  ORF Transcript_18397/g.51199 Transcript_18397/m.51199 type:complete len:246 (-) Transcript_18397:12-749(-)